MQPRRWSQRRMVCTPRAGSDTHVPGGAPVEQLSARPGAATRLPRQQGPRWVTSRVKVHFAVVRGHGRQQPLQQVAAVALLLTVRRVAQLRLQRERARMPWVLAVV